MDYDKQNQRIYKPEFSIERGLPYGELPDSMTAIKHEDTAYEEDDQYDNYARKQITDWTGDTNLFEHERPRRATHNYGILQLRANGHRGNADWEKPEIFLGHGGVEDRDPRGTTDDPDMQKLRSQHAARQRFIRHTPDHSEHVTGGGWSESQVIAARQEVFRRNRKDLKVFSRQIDGRRNPLRRVYAHKSEVPKQVLVQGYGDVVKDYALNPQRRATILTHDIIRNTREYRDGTMDQDYVIAKYSQNCRRQKRAGQEKKVVNRAEEGQFSTADTTKQYKAAGILMANLVAAKKQASESADGDIAMYASSDTSVQKSTPLARDLGAILTSISSDGKLATADVSQHRKTRKMEIGNLHGESQANHSTPAHHYLNAEIIYKAAARGDLKKIRSEVITDVEGQSDENKTTKSAKRQIVTGAKLDTREDTDHSDSERTVKYKQSAQRQGQTGKDTVDAQERMDSDNTQDRKYDNRTAQRTAQVGTQHRGINFSDNTSKERHGGRIGTKYTMRDVTRQEGIAHREFN